MIKNSNENDKKNEEKKQIQSKRNDKFWKKMTESEKAPENSRNRSFSQKNSFFQFKKERNEKQSV